MKLKDKKEFYDSLPKKRMSAGALFFNEQRELLIVKPNYRDYWSIPGGAVDIDESPLTCCQREVEEEIGLAGIDFKFLGVDYRLNNDFKGEAIHFLFYGGILREDQIKSIKLFEEELEDYKFLPLSKVLPLMAENMRKKLPHCLEAIKNNTVIYLEGGELTKTN